MDITVDIEGLDELLAVAEEAAVAMRMKLGPSVRDAVIAGGVAAYANHPYTDRTWHLSGDVRPEPALSARDAVEFDMTWPVRYASFVDKGTERSRPYPFTPQAREAASRTLNYAGEALAERFADTIDRAP